MPWWAWLVLGIGLLGVEMPQWTQWLVFAVLANAAMLAFRRRLYEMVRGRAGRVDERLTVGDRVVIATRLEPGQSRRVEYRGSSWTARNTGALATSVVKSQSKASP